MSDVLPVIFRTYRGEVTAYFPTEAWAPGQITCYAHIGQHGGADSSWLQRNGRDALTTDYSQGVAHCPSWDKKPPAAFNRPPRMWREIATTHETETGRTYRPVAWGDLKGEAIPGPDVADVLYSLVTDSSVLDYARFEDWAPDLGYDLDSREAEKVYRACLEIALTMRAAIGDSGLESLRNAFQDY